MRSAQNVPRCLPGRQASFQRVGFAAGVGAATLVSRVTAAMQLDQFCREHEELLGVLGELWELAEPGSGDQQRVMALVTQVLHRQLVWLVAEADRLELVSELALTTAPMATGMATGQ